ncbi:hypothetical protein HLB44_12470 [Aquincola sp. S2]|uniref:Dystroglycan-type cadherin-like domain-containing protein n=1 Tax=Pseudaquabacterium terrae TaxID=2732868 RepID=A0ABX2EGN8_9BURK|nr:putative Ig domain-containing protein [Aquabacterium terrae]NRF67799.1 hypothetical protein [Aquabacterium terrae]
MTDHLFDTPINLSALTATGVNHAPLAVAPLPDLSWTEGRTAQFVVPRATFYDGDGDGDALRYYAIQADGSELPSWMSFHAPTRTLSGQPHAGARDVSVLIVAVDPWGAYGWDQLTVRTPAAASPKLVGTSSDDVLWGTQLDDLIRSYAGADRIAGGNGDDTIDGGMGIDTALFSGAAYQYELSWDAAAWGWSLRDLYDGRDGRDLLLNVERLQFTDIAVALDLGGNAGRVARLIGAVAGIDGLGDERLVGRALGLKDAGYSDVAIAYELLRAEGLHSPAAVVAELWTNLFGTPPAAWQSQPYVDMIERGTSAAELAVMAADTELNAQRIDLVGLSWFGLGYVADGS